VLTAATLLASSPLVATASPAASEDVPVPGGTAALAGAVGIAPVPDQARFAAELARLVYSDTKERRQSPDSAFKRLIAYLDGVEQLEAALAAQHGHGGVSLAMASARTDSPERNALSTLLALVGLRLGKTNAPLTVERIDLKPAEHARLFSHLGIDAHRLEAALNRGETVRIEVATELVPLPLPAVVWSESVLRRPVAPARLFAAVMSDPRAALLVHGLSALDDETLQFFADHPGVVRQLYEDGAPAFSAFAAHLRIRRSRVAPPGGDQAVPLWEAMLGEQMAQPERFVRQLFTRNEGRVAYVYDTIGSLDPSRTSFALGTWISDGTIRVERFKALASAVTSVFGGWSVEKFPFRRPQHDLVSMLLRVQVAATGVPEFPAWRAMWARILGDSNDAGEPARALEHPENAELIDAAWLVETLLRGDGTSRLDRLDQFAFGQRAFALADPAALSDMVTVLQAFPRFRMLMLTLERIGVGRPALYAALVRQAERVSALDEVRGRVALAEFQGAIALVARLTRVQTIDRANAETLLQTLAAVPFDRDRGYMGGLTQWLLSQLLPALGAGRDLEDQLLNALAGAPGAIPQSLVSWEGQQYRFDLVTPEVQRLRRARERQGGYSIDAAMSLHAIAQRLAVKPIASNDIHAAITRLKELTTLPGNARETVDSAIEDLAKMPAPPVVSQVAGVAGTLVELVDVALGEALLSISYAVDLGDPRGTPGATGSLVHRHDFGLAHKGEDTRVRTAWALPKQVFKPGIPWHVKGAALGLDVALASLTLRRIDTAPPAKPPAIDPTERDAFATSVALMNPFVLRDEDRDAIAMAIARGGRRVDALAAGDGNVDAIVQEIAMDGWRVGALRWTIRHAPERIASLFSMTDLLYLGGGRGMDLNPWGMSAITVNGCLCTQLAGPGLSAVLLGQPHPGVLATTVADLNLRVAVALADMRLPAPLAKSVLAVAVQDFVDRVQPSDAGDWLTRVRSAQGLSRERIEDYVATATADGPLVPDTSSVSARVPR
jgi:hypothetical protein